MKRTSWPRWLLAALLLLAVCFVATEAQYKFRRPQLPPPPPPLPPPQIFKKSWAPGPRIPPMGNSVHIAANFPGKRPLFKPPNYRFRRPPVGAAPPPPPPASMFNVLPSGFKSPMSQLAGLGSFGGSSQRGPPVKELQSLAKLPQQFSPEYRPAVEPSLSLPLGHLGHRAGLDDDKGPIHTIPAPNLGPASKSYQQQHLHHHHQQQQQQQQQQNDEQPRPRPYTISQVDYASIFGQETSVAPQRVAPANPSTSSIPHQYEVTESNEINSAAPAYFSPDFESTRYSSSGLQEQQANDVYPSHVSASSRVSQQQQQQLAEPSQQQADAASTGVSMQANLHVGSANGPAEQPQSELHLGQPGQPINAAKLYEVLNAFPHRLTEQYALNQAPQMQQHLLQQQLSQLLQQQQQQQHADQGSQLIKASFSQPTLHSFNYDEQSNKQSQQQQQQQQQNIFIDQNYASGKVTADYSLAPEAPEISQEIGVVDVNEQQENNIEFDSPIGHVKPTTYFTKIGNEPSVSTQFYTTLPNRDAAEKLAALAAAGNVNSQLIGQLRKQQQQQQQQQQQLQGQQQLQADQPLPTNHKDTDEEEEMEGGEEEHRKQPIYRRHKVRAGEQPPRREEEREKQRQSAGEDKRPLRILVPESGNPERESEPTPEDYEYENDEADHPPSREAAAEEAEFGSRLVSKGRD